MTAVDECFLLNTKNNVTYECNKWLYDESQMKTTIITEYGFVCKKNYYFELLYTIEQIGNIIGAIIFSFAANKIGKRLVLLFILTFTSFLGIMQFFIKQIYAYTAIGFLINSLVSGLDTVIFPLTFETIKANQRTRYGMTMSYIWVIIFTCLSPLAYIIKRWRELRLAIFIVLSVLSILSCIIVQESAMWLISKGEFNKACVVIKKIAKINRLDEDENFKEEFVEIKNKLLNLNRMQKEKSELQTESANTNIFYEIFKQKRFLFYLVIMVFSWFVRDKKSL